MSAHDQEKLDQFLQLMLSKENLFESQTEVVDSVLDKQLDEYVEFTKLIPLVVPKLNKGLENVKHLLPLYEDFRNWIRSEIQSSVLSCYSESFKATGGSEYASLELTKLMIDQPNRISDAIKNIKKGE